ncbi:MAG TPA: CHAT domain-containing protein [Bryobacteraceae bacterium]|jgi:tetratricopeptide (TPR) repeat protein
MNSSNNTPVVTAAVPKIRVQVVHGDLAFARHMVAVGHYEGDSIVGPEALLDRYLEGRLTLHNQLGTYPGQVGSAEVFLSLDRASRVPGAVVMGLGKVGDLQPKDLQQTFYKAVLKYALAVRECADTRFEKEGSDGLTTLLIGTMANVLTIEESLTAMLRAIRDANSTLATDAGAKSSFRIRSVEVLEVFEDRAIRSADALARIAKTPELVDALELAASIVLRGGRLRQSLIDEEDAAWWSRLRIQQAQEHDPLTFTLFTNRARSESEDVEEPQRAAPLIASAIQSPRQDPLLAHTLFEILVPNRLKEYAPHVSRLALIVDQNSAGYPWELMQAGLGRSELPLAVDTGLVRQLDLKDFRQVIRQSEDRTALVVANPSTQPPAGRDREWRFEPLPGAAEEGVAVASELARLGVAVDSKIETAAADIRQSLYTGSYRILHLAGHGVQQYKTSPGEKPVNGMVIGYRDFLTPSQVGQLRVVPELVFINCCHLGRTDILAANLAVEFIRIGVRAVIAAGWAVDDAAASTFARSFYCHFLEGAAFGDAVRMARAETYEQHRSVNTWGAYQCYGDPGYRFDREGFVAPRQEAISRPLFLPSQLATEIDNLASGTQTGGAESGDAVATKLEALKHVVRPEWWNLGRVQASLGRLHGELGNYDAAVSHYEKARRSEDADAPIRALEQEANLRARAAAQRIASAAKEDRESAHAKFVLEIEAALQLVRAALELGKTAERYGIEASIFKRKAERAQSNEALRESLAAMRTSYGNAVAVPGQSDSQYASSFLNWNIARVVLRWFDTDEPEISVADWKAIEEEIGKGRLRVAADPTFWNAMIEPDARLAQYLASSPAESSDVGIGYRRATEEFGSPREVATVIEHLSFIRTMAQVSHNDRIAQTLDRTIRELSS